MSNPTDRIQFLPLDEVRRRTTLSKSTVYELMRRGKFPRPANLGGRNVRWLESEIDSWAAERAAERSI